MSSDGNPIVQFRLSSDDRAELDDLLKLVNEKLNKPGQCRLSKFFKLATSSGFIKEMIALILAEASYREEDKNPR